MPEKQFLTLSVLLLKVCMMYTCGEMHLIRIINEYQFIKKTTHYELIHFVFQMFEYIFKNLKFTFISIMSKLHFSMVYIHNR